MHLQIGSDPRLTGPLLRAALSAGLVSKGAQVADFGLATTPAMFMSCILPGKFHACMTAAKSLGDSYIRLHHRSMRNLELLDTGSVCQTVLQDACCMLQLFFCVLKEKKKYR